MRLRAVLAVLAILPWHVPAYATGNIEGPIVSGGQAFSSWSEFFQSDYFKQNGKRCGTPELDEAAAGLEPPSDCSLGSTNPSPPQYAPGTVWEIPTVVHILHSVTGQGNLTDEIVFSQIDVLNEDFRAIPGTPGAPGTDATLQFALAAVDPSGNPTNGITRSANDFWFNDTPDPALGDYWDNLAWDPDRYCNIYTNVPMGAGGIILGYVADFPQSPGYAGSNEDRVVILYSSFGRPSPNPPYHLGRTATHEIGHYVGLYHTFQSGCGSGAPPGCYTTGDRICDTPGETGSHGGCPIGSDGCTGDGGPDPIHNYMEYTDDDCMNNFTPEQARRARCTLIHYRPQVFNEITVAVRADESPSLPMRLTQNRPNPFSPATELSFELVRTGRASLVVMDVNGRPVRTLASGILPQGSHRLVWDGTNDRSMALASGVYFYRLETDEGSETRRMILVR